MARKPTADGMRLERSLIKDLQSSRLAAIGELVSMKGITRDSGRANAHEGNIRGTKGSSRSRFRRS